MTANEAKIPVVWDMETGDPDDFLTLLLLLGHPRVDLRAVTVTPGGPDQIGLVRWAMRRLGQEHIPVGAARDPAALAQSDVDGHGRVKSRVSGWHYRAYGKIPPSEDAEDAVLVMERVLGPGTLLITGGPPKNPGRLLSRLTRLMAERGDEVAPNLGRLVVQGGFAGEGVVPPERQLRKFRGMETCPTFNLNGAVKETFRILERRGWFEDLRFVSKNVCHGVFYDAALHERARIHLADLDPESTHARSLAMVRAGMGAYLRRKPGGKAFHDPLAACCGIDPAVGEWAEVELYRKGGKWGARLEPGSGVRIIVGYDAERFQRVLLGA